MDEEGGKVKERRKRDLRQGMIYLCRRIWVQGIKVVLLVLVCAALTLRCEQRDSRSFTTPFIDLKAPEKSLNTNVPQITYEPLILIEIINPDTKQSVKCFGYLDTGSDQCFIKKELAEKLGLKIDGQPPHEVHTASGRLSLNSTIVEYVLAGTGEGVKNYPVQRAPFFIHDFWLPADVVLGNIGFLDRFKEVRIAYPKDITLMW